MNTRHLALLGSLFVSGLIMFSACGDNGPSGSSGTGGHGGNAGKPGMTGSSGGNKGAVGGHVGSTGGSTGAGGASCANIPSCLAFLSNCYPGGSCMSQNTITLSPPSATVSKCYSNGVKEATTGSLSGGTVTSGTTMVSLNGTFCYAYDLSLGAGGKGGSGPSLTFKNASGAVLATVVSANATTTTFSCSGQMYQVPSSCTAAVAAMQTGTSCSAGTCP